MRFLFATVAFVVFISLVFSFNQVGEIQLALSALTVAFFSSALSARAFFSDLKGISLSSWKVTTRGRRIFVAGLSAVCGALNYFFVVLLINHQTYLEGFWIVLVFGLLVIMSASIMGFFFEKVFIKLKWAFK